jgi:basic amino acid/polyamine antiporter, APA family
VLGIVFVLTRTFEQLADTFVLSIWPFYGLAVAGLYRLRRTHPPADGAYSTPGYPVVPAVFIAGVVYLVASALYGDPLWTSVTFGIVLSGSLIFLAMGRRASAR